MWQYTRRVKGEGRAALITAWIAALSAAGLTQPADTSTRSVVARAADYVREYQRQLTSVVADEHYVQDVLAQVPRDEQGPRSRAMQGEVFFMFAPSGRTWMAIRDVMSADGRPLADRPDVQAALRTLPAREVAGAMKKHNSRLNLGRIYRNFNEPTLSLLVLDDEHRSRFSFDRKRLEQADGQALVTVAFVEKESPTLIVDLEHGRVLSRGELLIEAATGRVRRAMLTARIQDTKVLLETTYAPDDRLGIWVPSVFREQYEYGVAATDSLSPNRAEYEQIRCEARYTNYRRFETTVRVK